MLMTTIFLCHRPCVFLIFRSVMKITCNFQKYLITVVVIGACVDVKWHLVEASFFNFQTKNVQKWNFIMKVNLTTIATLRDLAGSDMKSFFM